MKKLLLIFSFAVLIASNVRAQEPMTGLYQYNYTSISPTFAGLDGQKVTMMGNYLETPNKSKITSGFVGYEFNADKINSGFGLTLNHDSFGAQSRSFVNVLYNYQIKINDKSKLVLGAKFTDYMLMINFADYIPIDISDPLPGSQTPIYNMLMFGIGALYKHDRFFIGASTDNLLMKSTTSDNNYVEEGKLIHYTLGVNFKITRWLSSTHSLYAITYPDFQRVDINNTFTFIDWIMLGASAEMNGDLIAKVNAGIKLKDKGQLALMLYTSDDSIPHGFRMQLMTQFKL